MFSERTMASRSESTYSRPAMRKQTSRGMSHDRRRSPAPANRSVFVGSFLRADDGTRTHDLLPGKRVVGSPHFGR
jgi:hypothetical protein